MGVATLQAIISDRSGGKPSIPTTKPTRFTHIKAMILKVAANAAKWRYMLVSAYCMAMGVRPRAFTACNKMEGKAVERTLE